MRKSAWILAVMLMALCSSNAWAAGDVVIGLNGGLNKFLGDSGEGWKMGFGGGATVDYMINDMWGAGVDFNWSSTKHEDDGDDAAVVYPGSGLTGEISDKFTLINFGAHGTLMFPVGEAKVKPYVVAGVGMYNGTEKFETDNYSEEFKTDSKFGGRGGVGATWMVNEQFGVGAEGNYHFISTEGESTTQITGALVLSFRIPTAK